MIHHHTVAYVSTDGIWVQSFIATWVNSLSPYFDKIGLLLHETKIKGTKQDTLIPHRNIVLESLGSEGKTWDRLQRISRIIEKCRFVSSYYEILLIRGITPRGYTVFKNTKIPKKYFLLVGSLSDSKPSFNLKKIYPNFMYFVRKVELKIMGKKMICMSNSLKVADEFNKLTGEKVYFTPTSSISDSDIKPYCEKKLDSNLIRILFCGRITKDKGVFELFNSILQLKIKLKKDVNLIMIGPVDTEIKAKLNRIAEVGGYADDVNWLGFIPFGSKLLEQINKADFCVLPSYHEGFPHIIWEAGICSVPMITTPVGGIPSVVSENEVSFITSKSTESIVEKIYSMTFNEFERNRKVKNLYLKACEFTLEKNASKLVNTINDTLH